MTWNRYTSTGELPEILLKRIREEALLEKQEEDRLKGLADRIEVLINLFEEKMR